MNAAESAASLLGSTLGNCTLERVLGIGGMGAVYLARQERPRRAVAVKVLRPQLSADPRAWEVFRERFRREADATAALDHANIVPIYAFGEDESIAYLVMPYLADGSLAQVLAHSGPLPLARANAYIGHAAAALDYAHAHGIVHRDVKPSNLLLHPDGRLLLADFGIARPLSGAELAVPPAGAFQALALPPADATLTQAGLAMGTPQYMAPEQIRGERVTSATDVYALATVTYSLLAGQTPFGGSDTVEILRQQLHEAPPPLRTLRPDVSAQVEEVLFWGLAKAPQDRPASAGAYASAFHRAASPRGLSAFFSRRLPLLPSQSAQLPHLGDDKLGQPRADSPQRALRSEETAVVFHAPRQSNSLLSSQRLTPGTVSAEPTQMDLAAPDAPTLHSNGHVPPAWPLAAATHAAHPRRRRRPGRVGILAAAAAVLVLVSALLVTHTFEGGTASGLKPSPALSSVARTSTARAAISPTRTPLPTPTSTALPTATATPVPPTATPVPPAPTNWLAARPTNLSIGCQKRHGAGASVTLTNSGLQAVRWSAELPANAGIAVTPTSGTLPRGASTTIAVTNTSVIFGRQGGFLLKPDSADAGQPVEITYTTTPCV